MDFAQKNAHNLRVLRRLDSFVAEILDSTSHVVLYEFDEERQSWNKRGIEGSLFILRRQDQPLQHRLLILNRLGIDNLEVDLNDDIEFQVTGDYVIYRDPRMEHVQGLWIYEAQDRIRMAESLQDKCATSYIPPPLDDATVPAHPTHSGINLMHLLMNPSAVPSPTPPQQQLQPITAPIKHLQVLWSVLDTCLLPHHAPRSLELNEFVERLGRCVQEPGFQRSLYEAYKTV
ncbi:mRNA-decapping enzyme 1B [Podochytrium sp. JEL0797]|nr:mRNA-decapping enzyme 1B [Podochytrium sp. JEL0797]